nr:uncharacterized protein LOC121116182 [Lepeophtheirus salmonis]
MKVLLVILLFNFLHRSTSFCPPHEQKCVASNELTFNRISSITINKKGKKDCGKNCRIIYPNATQYLIFYQQQEDKTRCLCFDDEALPIKRFIDEDLCNIPCPQDANKTCGGLHHSLSSSKIQVYYSSLCIALESSVKETTSSPSIPTTINPISPSTMNPFKTVKLSETIEGYIVDSYNKTIVIIVLQTLLIFILILALIWYSICHEDSKMKNKIPDIEPCLSQGIKPTQKNGSKSALYPPVYGSTEESDPGNEVTREGNSTFYK